MKIDPNQIESMEKARGIEVKVDSNGMPVAWKGVYLPDWFDNYMECHKENQNARRKHLLAAEGKNEHGQTKEEEKAFNDRKRIQLERKKKAEAALLASAAIEKGG